MIYQPLTAFVRSTEMPVQVGATVTAEGQALVSTRVNGVQGVSPSAGVAGEQFVGFATAQVSAAPFLEQVAVRVESLVVNAGGSVTTAMTPLAGTVSVFDNTLGAKDASIALTGSTISTLTPGNNVTVTYSHALTVAQAVFLQGNQQPGGYSGSLLGQIGVGQGGKVFTNQIDTAANWNVATAVKLAAGGMLTDQTGAGVAINAIILQIPTVDSPFLGLEFQAV